MGVVYLADDPVIGRPVAVKVLHTPTWASEDEASERRLRFEAESKAAGQLSHSNIVTVYDVGWEDDSSFIAMEYVAGESLADRLERSRTMSLAGTAYVAIQVGRALDFAHQNGIVHRDVKPANILLTVEDQAKITDFGIAKLADSRVTGSDIVLGTPWYMAPEQILSQEISGACDQFALGVILYEMVTGVRPFDGDHPTSILYKIVHEPPAPVLRGGARLAPELERVLLRALAKRPEERFGSCGELAAAFAAAQAPPTVGSGTRKLQVASSGVVEVSEERTGDASVDNAPTTRTRPRFSHPPARLPFVLALVAASVAAAGWMAWRSDQAPALTQTPPPVVTRAVQPVVLHPVVVGSKPEGAEIYINGERTELRTPQEVTLRGRRGDIVRLEVRLGSAVARTDLRLTEEGMDHWSPTLASSVMAPRDPGEKTKPGTTAGENVEPGAADREEATPGTGTQNQSVLAGAKVWIRTRPEGSSVTLDGAAVPGVTPLKLVLFPGSQIHVTHDGYRPWQHVVTVREAPQVLRTGRLPEVILLPAGPLGTVDPAVPTVAAGTTDVPQPKVVVPAVPLLPPGSGDERLEGVVILRVVLDPTGVPAKVEVIRHLDEVCDQAAIDAVLRRRYAPTLVDGRPVNVEMTETVFFPPGRTDTGQKEDDGGQGSLVTSREVAAVAPQ